MPLAVRQRVALQAAAADTVRPLPPPVVAAAPGVGVAEGIIETYDL